MEIEMRHHYTPTRIAKSGTLTTENADEVWSNRNSHSLLVRIQKGTATLKGSFLKSKTYSYHAIQKSYSLIFTQMT